MSAVQLWKIEPGVIPTPEPGSVFLFVDEGGAICCKTSSGEVARVVGAAGEKGAQGDAGPQGSEGPVGPAGAVLVDALAVGAYAMFKCSAGAGALVVNSTVDGWHSCYANLEYMSTLVVNAAGSVWSKLPAGQSWRVMSALSIGVLMQRVS